MEPFFEILCGCPLFQGIERAELPGMMACLNAKTAAFSKGEPVFGEGDPARFVGIVLSGAVQVVRDDYYGNRSVLAVVQPGGLFAEAFACAGLEAMPVSVIALKPGQVLLLDCKRVLTVCANACPHHSRLVSNLLRGMAQKNLSLTRKIRYMSQKTTKEKLLAFLLDQAKQQGSAEFIIPYNRQALADYLGVERSAMSAELSKLKREGLIESRGSWFHVIAPGEEPSV